MSEPYIARHTIISAHELDIYEHAEQQMVADNRPIVVDWALIEDEKGIAQPESPELFLTITADSELTFNQYMARVGIAAAERQLGAQDEE